VLPGRLLSYPQPQLYKCSSPTLSVSLASGCHWATGTCIHWVNEFRKGNQPRTNFLTCFETPTVFWVGGRIISIRYSIYVGLRCYADCSAYSWATVAWAPCLWVSDGCWKPKKTASVVDQIAAELIKAGNKTICSEIRKEELPAQWKEPNFVPFYKKGDKTDCSNYGAISLLLIVWRPSVNLRYSHPIVLPKLVVSKQKHTNTAAAL